jgi:hypothetical protein
MQNAYRDFDCDLIALVATHGAEAVIRSKLVTASSAEGGAARSRCGIGNGSGYRIGSRLNNGLRNRCIHILGLLRGCYRVGRNRSGLCSRCRSRCSRCLAGYGDLNGLTGRCCVDGIVFIVAHRRSATGAVYKTICIPGTEIQRIVGVLYDGLAVFASLLISQTAVPLSSFITHVETSFLI